MSHFPTADAADLARTTELIARMERFLAELAPPDNVLIHTHNSAATVRLTSQRRGMVRVGAACFGVRTSQDFENPPQLRPVMAVRTRVAQVRDVLGRVNRA